MKLVIYIWILMIPGTGIAAELWNQSEPCSSLKGIEQEVALSVLKSQRPYDCCDATILECLSKEPVCPLVQRLADDICHRAAAGQTKDQIDEELSKRAASTTAPLVDIDISKATPAGDPEAKIEIVAYVCARCPFCAVFSQYLYKSVTSGRLKGKARFYIRPFVLRSHYGSTTGAMAMLAAQHMGKFWEMYLYMCENYSRFDHAKLPDWAALNGMDADRFRELMEDDDIRQELLESQKEAIRNELDSTPEVFVNRRMYFAQKTQEVFEDFIEGEYERLP
jgi:predicted DsbA family dithiol-disulfide isomerase